jgi:hypothetical protein
MSLYQQAAQLNNQGIVSLLKGDHCSAIHSMSEAIKVMKGALSAPPGTNTPMKCRNVMYETRSIEISSLESSDTIVFSQAIRLPDSDEEREPGEVEMNVYSGAIIFNLALAHHFRGDKTSLARAEKFYGLVIKVLNRNMLHMHTALIVKLACINNLSQMRYSKGEYERVSEGFIQVAGFIQQNEAVVNEPEVQGLLMSVLLLKAPTVAPAA